MQLDYALTHFQLPPAFKDREFGFGALQGLPQKAMQRPSLPTKNLRAAIVKQERQTGDEIWMSDLT